MSDAFEQWAADKSFLFIANAGEGYINVKEMAREAWKAALQSGEPIAAVKGWFHGECVIQALDPEAVLPAGMALYAAPQPVLPEVRVLSRDEARLALWRAIQEVVVGNPTDDKLILENLYKSGVWLCLLSAGKGE